MTRKGNKAVRATDSNAIPEGGYGLAWPSGIDRWTAERALFKCGWKLENGGVGRYRHFRNWFDRRWPEFEWHPWAEWIVSTLCDDTKFCTRGEGEETTILKTLGLAGCAAAGKTHTIAAFALAWWEADPENSAVVLCSTQKDMARKRIWPVVTWMHTSARDCREPARQLRQGVLIDSRNRLLAKRGDDKHCVSLIAVKGGDTQEAVTHLRGTHAERILVMVDEATATPEAILETVPNLRKGCREFILVVIDNCGSHLDSHGLVCEPKDGWGSISVESEEWKTKGVPKWQIEPGVCLHLDGEKSPNVLMRKTKWPYLYTWEDHLAASTGTSAGEELRNTAGYWQHDRGFWVPEGVSDRLFSEVLFEKYEAVGDKQFEFLSESRMVSFLDPAFGGDKCCHVIGRFGDIPGGKEGLQILSSRYVDVSAVSNDERDYQIARKVMEWCRQLGVQPECHGTDATGTGRGVHAILAAEWSPLVRRVEFGMAGTDRASSGADGRPGREVYANMVTEMWFSFRDFVVSGQVRGLYADAVIQFCARPYRMQGRRYMLVPKQECRVLLKGRSPDDADACAGLLEVCRRLGFQCTGKIEKAVDRQWDKMVEDTAKDAAPEATLDELDDEKPGTMLDSDVTETDMCDMTL